MGFDRESPFMSYFVFGFGVEILEPGWGCLWIRKLLVFGGTVGWIARKNMFERREFLSNKHK